jgi:UDP-GlcNAc:undecaprenyl-phosphate/decaprenyl-phosphate GlcNAc-1-phosphate transferase
MFTNLLVAIISALIAKITIPFVYNMLLTNKCTALNYNKIEIPLGMGIVFILIQTIVVYLLSLYLKINAVHSFSYIVSMLLIGVIGLIDDLIGEKDVKGFKGHIKSLIKGKLTTGGLKAVIGFGAAFLVSIVLSDGYLNIVLNTFIIAFFTNLVNLFDLRPGRANKAFLFFSIVLLFTGHVESYNFIIFSAIGIIIIYMPYDLKSKAMMGDVGSNALGITLGVYCILSQSFMFRLVYFILLIILHIIAEFYSFSKIICKIKFLKYIDEFGRDTM